MKRGTNLRGSMIAGGVSAIMIPFIIAGIITYGKLSDSIVEIYRERSLQMALDMSLLITSDMEQELKFVRAMSVNPDVIEAVSRGNYRLAEKNIKTIFNRLDAEYSTFFIADRKGIVRSDANHPEQLGVDVSDRKYFRDAMKGRASLVGPLVSKGPEKSRWKGMVVVMACSPIFNNGEFAGIVNTMFEVDYFVKRITSTRAGKTGYPFVIDADGQVLVHHRKDLILNRNLFNEPGMEKIIKRMTSHETGVEEYVFEGRKKIAGFTTIEITGWIVAFTQDVSEIMEPVNAILTSLLASALLFAGLAILIVILFSRRISSPIQKMIDLLMEITIHSKEVIFNIGLDHRIFYANPAAGLLTGKEPAQLIGDEPFYPVSANVTTEEIWQHLENGEIWSGNVSMPDRNGENCTLSLFIVPIKDSSDRIHSYLEIGRDVTRELMYEERLRQSQKMEALGTLAGGIAHDFNNILSGIFGYTELSLLVEGNPGSTTEYLKQIMKAAERARDITSRILTFSRKTNVELRPVLPKIVLDETLQLVSVSVPSSIEIRYSTSSESPIMAEPTLLHQVIVNLCTNAIHSMKDMERGVLSVGVEDFYVTPEYAAQYPDIREGRHVLVKITDTGSGIEPDIMKRIFDPFFTTKPSGEGTGLGLSVVHGIVKNMNGMISVSSEPGKGSTFSILIPVAGDGHSDGPSAVDCSIRRGSERIIYVDDEESILYSFAEMMENLGYTVSAFTDTSSALAAFTENPGGYDILITDYSMAEWGALNWLGK